ncbi:uncharacterized protein LOC133031198 [Cannabis sativa]|uniref:uncharacterized protein LOC133031198 n=1 Tax=Cannabis sativa TaxID=3483 RepID=UPI0029C9C69B|nr:uncharacterized protein LOC133031198 [Cannabis sativa]
MEPIVPSRAFSALICKFEEKKWLHGCKVANGGPSVSHMLFADGSFLYCKATNGEMNRVLQLLRMFATAMGQRVNFGKSFVFFSTNTSSHLWQAICATLGIHEATEHSMYLRLPSTVGRNINVIFGYFRDKVQKRIQSWDNKFLSRAGKEVLIKSVVQSLPAYTMNVFLIPVGICQDIEGAITKFWWRSNKNKGIH